MTINLILIKYLRIRLKNKNPKRFNQNNKIHKIELKGELFGMVSKHNLAS
jgi:hypothetical protein